MPDEVQPLDAATPDHPADQAAAASAVSRNKAPVAAEEKAVRPPAETSDARPAAPRPVEAPAPSERPSTPVSAPKPGPATAPRSGGGSSNRVRARLARLGVQRSSPYNPVLEPLLRTVRGNDPKIETATLRQIERAYQVAERWHRGQKRKSGDPYITHPLAVTTILAELGMDPATLMARRCCTTPSRTPSTAWTPCAATSATRSRSWSTA